MYHIVFLLLLLFSFVEIFSHKKMKIESYIIFLLLLLMVTFRYGQGADYFNYIYFFVDSSDSFETALKTKDFTYVTREVGFSAISYLWIKVFRFSPESISALFSAISFFLVWLFVKKYSLKPILSLFVFYCTFYLVYPFSAIRQAICISIFIFYLIPLLHKRKYLKYYFLSALLFTIHFSSIILFVIPIVNLVKKYKPLHIYFFSIIALFIGLVLYQALYSFFSLLDVIGSRVEYYSEEKSLDILSLFLRIIIFIPIFQTYRLYERNSIKDLFLKIYILGFFLYLLFLASSLISSRINVFMRYFEMILLVDFLVLVFKRNLNIILSYVYIFAIMTVLYVKNIDSFIYQGAYYNHINFYNYPYISVFNKKEVTESRYILPYFQKFVIYEE